MSSQHDEDTYISDALRDYAGQNRFLDIGAWDPITFSNTRALFEAGWGGIMIEPSPVPFEKLLREYGREERITLICAAVGIERGLVKITASADAVSTTSADVAAQWKDAGGYYGEFQIPRITIGDILNQFGGGFGFVNIDTEGSSVDLFYSLMDSGARPTCVCVEHDGRVNELTVRATAEGYRMIRNNGCNAILKLK